jgi:NAD(P)-dependent dehydrogenase (short-subunit alcohol dehydrogenase family)
VTRLHGRIALITGASRGIGAAVARRFAAEGAQVVLAARTVGGLEEVDDAIRASGGAGATLVPLDLRDGAAIDQLAPAIAGRFGRLDILVANAGVLGVLGPVGHLTPDVWDEVIAINLTANWRLIRALDPLLRASDAGRAILVSSGAVAHNPAYWGAYTASKAGLEALGRTWAAETQKTALRVNLINPGATRTAMRAAAMPGEDPLSLKSPDQITEAFVALAEPACTRHGELVQAREFRSESVPG